MQQAGEMLFVPSTWWHTVLNVDDTVAVTQNFINTGNFHFVWPEIESHNPTMAKQMRQKIEETNRMDLFERYNYYLHANKKS